MPTAKKLYTFNETIVTTGVAPITGSTEEEFSAATESFVADESNYITIAVNGVTAYLLPLYGISDGDTLFVVYVTPTKPMDINNPEGAEVLHYTINDGVVYSMAGFVCEITDMGGMSEWVLANTTSRTQIDVESPNGVKLLLNGKLGTEDISVIPKLLEGSATPTTEMQTISAPEGYAGFKSFTVNKIPSDYVIPSGSVTITRNGTYGVWGKSEAIVEVSVTTEEKSVTPTKETQEVTPSAGAYLSKVTVDKIPDEYIIPEGDLTVTENVTGMDISDKKTLTVDVAGGTELNLAFGDTAPEDTGKLWVKTAEPLSVEVKLNAEVTGNDGLLSGIAAIPTAAYGIGTAAVGTKVYLFGGRIGTTSTNSNSYSSAIRVFDTETGTVETLSTTLPNKAEGIAAAAVGTKIYLFGGYYYSSGEVHSSAIRVFNTETGTVETLSTALPKGAYNMGTAAVGTKIYLFGGRVKATSAYSSYLTTILAFNTETGTIETLSTALPNRAERMGTAAVGTKIYLFGGCSYDDGIVYLSAIRVFNTETGTIETLSTTLPTRTASMGAAAVGTKIYLFGGYGEQYLSAIRVFDTETGTIETLSTTLPTLTEGMGTATVGTKVYLFGGCYLSTYYSSIHQFTALIDLPENHMMIEASAFENRFNLLPNLEIGVKNVYLGDLFGRGKRVAAALYKDGAWVEI